MDDLRYHTTTLFPPVRPRGWLELRVIDALPEAVRPVAVLVAAALCHPGVAQELERRMPDTSALSVEAARSGLAHPILAEAADVLFDAVTAAVPDLTRSAELAEALGDFDLRYVRRRRSPAHDQPDCVPSPAQAMAEGVPGR